ncbi:MAG: HAD hydrolase-like protein [Chloroherpetonaceae bacterium]|nr:HAD hydrolase-like protein [Chloroherpetonaceae bacterium]
MNFNSKIKGIIFDLDGTLADIAESINFVLQKHHFPTHPHEAYKPFTGEGLKMLVTKSLPETARTPEMIEQCTAEMIAYYTPRSAN